MSEIVKERKPSTAMARETARRIFKNEEAVLMIVLVALISAMAVLTKGATITKTNITSIWLQNSVTGIASIGQLFVILTGGIDMSIGGLAVMSMVGAARLLVKSDPDSCRSQESGSI